MNHSSVFISEVFHITLICQIMMQLKKTYFRYWCCKILKCPQTKQWPSHPVLMTRYFKPQKSLREIWGRHTGVCFIYLWRRSITTCCYLARCATVLAGWLRQKPRVATLTKCQMPQLNQRQCSLEVCAKCVDTFVLVNILWKVCSLFLGKFHVQSRFLLRDIY